MIRCAAFALLFVCLASLAVAAAPTQPDKPALLIEAEVGDAIRVSVALTLANGQNQRVLLRESHAHVVAGATGWDPSGTSAFATWDEDGQRFMAYSRDGGQHWVDARKVKTAIHLRQGLVTTAGPMPRPAAGLTADGSEEIFLVHFVATELPEWRAAIKRAGGRLLAYLPHNTHIVRIPATAARNIAALDFVERIETYEAGYRISEELARWLEEDDDGQDALRDLRVMAFEWGPEGKARIAAATQAIGGEVLKQTPNGHIIVLRLGREQLKRLLHHDDLMWAESWTPAETDMDLVRKDAGTDWIEDQLGYCGDGVRGEVLDSGVQEDHMDFDGILLHGDHNTASHGTSTYGIVFGNGNRDGDGEAKATGHMPCAQGIFADYGSLNDRFAHTQELKRSPYFASFQTNSWGSSRTLHYTSVSHEVDDIIWRLDIALLQSQSNAGSRQSRPQAWAKNIISVGGIRHKDTLDEADDAWSRGASIGPAEDGRIKPDIHYWYDHIYTTTTGNGYRPDFGGTSGATPEAAGVVGLMIQLWANNIWGNDPQGNTVFEKQPHFATIKAMAINYAKQYSFSGSDSDLTRVHQGWGRPSVRIAKERAARNLIIDESQALAFDERARYEVEVLAGESELKVTMVYPDPPGTTSASVHRINNLNLKVTAPSGTVYWGNNGLLEGNYSTSGGVPNDLDTVENVFVQNPESGTWTVEVHAAEINQDAFLDTSTDDAVFALVVSGGGGSVCEKPTADFTITPNPAQIAEDVLFNSTVSGGAGAPYSYAWDFDEDGTTDATEADPLHVYNHAFEGLVTLEVKDAEGCATRVGHTITVTGPDIRYHEYLNLTELEGNGNGAIDPGETFELTVKLRNAGNGTATDVEARLRVAASTTGPVVMLSKDAAYGDLAPSAMAAGTPAYRFRVGSAFPCGENIVFDVTQIRSAKPAVTYPDAVGAFRLLVGGSGAREEVWSDGFETSKGWSETGNGEWQRGTPQGLGAGSSIPGHTSFPDPTSARTGNAVIGNDLSGTGRLEGNYEDNSSSVYSSPALDLSNSVLVEVEFYRWLNVLPDDRAAFEVTKDGSHWTPLFEATKGVTDSNWARMSFDLREIADRSSSFRMRYALTANEMATASGWNVDDLRITAVPKSSCQPFGVPAPGVSDGLMIEREDNGELTLRWRSDCGTGTAYGIYRGDLAAGYSSLAPEAGMCALSPTSARLPAGNGTADFFLVVPNDANAEGSYGSDSSAARRPPASTSCYPQDTIDACAP